jgi:hypothetical protein
MIRLVVLPSLALFLLLTGCAGPTDPAGFGGLDADGDGELTAADLEDGEVAVFLQRFDQSAGEPVPLEPEALTTLDATLSPGGSFGWYVNANLDGSALSLRFEVTESGLAVGDGAITNASLDVDDEHFAYASSPDGAVSISDVAEDGSDASGRVTGDVELDVYGAMEQPTGESIRIEAFAFKSVPVVEAE